MKFSRIQPRGEQLLQFFEEGLQSLGAISERPWHNRLEVLAEGETALLLQNDSELFSGELYFHDAAGPASDIRGIQVFPGCGHYIQQRCGSGSPAHGQRTTPHSARACA